MTASAAALGLSAPPALQDWGRRIRGFEDGLIRCDWDGQTLELAWRALPERPPPGLLPLSFEPGPLAAHKLVERSCYDRARAQARAAGFDDALLVDAAGYLLETTVANVFVQLGGLLVTPPDDGRILPGIARAALIRCKAGGVIERPVHLDEARAAEGLLLTSAAHDGLPVSRLETVCFDTRHAAP